MTVSAGMWSVDKHISVSIEGDVDIARSMEQTSTVTGLFLSCIFWPIIAAESMIS